MLVVATESAVSSAAVMFATRVLAGSAAMVVMRVVATRDTGVAVVRGGSAGGCGMVAQRW